MIIGWRFGYQLSLGLWNERSDVNRNYLFLPFLGSQYEHTCSPALSENSHL